MENASAGRSSEYNVNMNFRLVNNTRSKMFSLKQVLLFMAVFSVMCLIIHSLYVKILVSEQQISTLRSDWEVLKFQNEEFRRNIYRVVDESNTKLRLTSGTHYEERLLKTVANNTSGDVISYNDVKGPLVTTFIGALPEQYVIDSPYIGPWIKMNETSHDFNKFHLVENNNSIEVAISGLYMISTQIYYYGAAMNHYSYWILLNSESSSVRRKISKCSIGSVADSEASCYSSAILYLQRGDRLYLQQQENKRHINLRQGYSYIQLLLLSTSE